MHESSFCKSTEHLFLPVLEVHDPLLRCVHCNVFAYHETVKQLAKKKAYGFDETESLEVKVVPYFGRLWRALLRSWSVFDLQKSASSRARTAD